MQATATRTRRKSTNHIGRLITEIPLDLDVSRMPDGSYRWSVSRLDGGLIASDYAATLQEANAKLMRAARNAR